MENTLPFGEILEAADKLPIADQESLRDILTKRIIDRRRQLLSADKAIREAADQYIFVREAYLQNRRFQISGPGAQEDEFEDLEAELEALLEEEEAADGN